MEFDAAGLAVAGRAGHAAGLVAGQRSLGGGLVVGRSFVVPGKPLGFPIVPVHHGLVRWLERFGRMVARGLGCLARPLCRWQHFQHRTFEPGPCGLRACGAALGGMERRGRNPQPCQHLRARPCGLASGAGRRIGGFGLARVRRRTACQLGGQRLAGTVRRCAVRARADHGCRSGLVSRPACQWVQHLAPFGHGPDDGRSWIGQCVVCGMGLVHRRDGFWALGHDGRLACAACAGKPHVDRSRNRRIRVFGEPPCPSVSPCSSGCRSSPESGFVGIGRAHALGSDGGACAAGHAAAFAGLGHTLQPTPHHHGLDDKNIALADALHGLESGTGLADLGGCGQPDAGTGGHVQCLGRAGDFGRLAVAGVVPAPACRAPVLVWILITL